MLAVWIVNTKEIGKNCGPISVTFNGPYPEGDMQNVLYWGVGGYASAGFFLPLDLLHPTPILCDTNTK